MILCKSKVAGQVPSSCGSSETSFDLHKNISGNTERVAALRKLLNLSRIIEKKITVQKLIITELPNNTNEFSARPYSYY